ncbi:hypothetical protein FBZ88_101236 [Nitrospirillum bahiense]|uniref:Uncharacterized protein n=1 Tax=Nitrospirillum amazonense TaxID=28077 RepID=A0A560GD83_9PROT|nr:hypothetical protein FBZ88_101236 [Nitrospirillum amazonense]
MPLSYLGIRGSPGPPSSYDADTFADDFIRLLREA